MRTAAYARYSTEMQSAASIDDQLRNVRGYCARMGWPEPVAYSDAAMSGARNDRPAYRRLLAEAERYDVILVDDLSRLSRDSMEVTQVTRRLSFAGVRLIGVSDGTDTERKGHKAEVGLRGIMGELYLDDLREKVHRGLTGKALAGRSAGGLPYGYRVTETGLRAIREDQADVVRRIYAEYLSGLASREIACRLNRDGVPSPRGSTWAVSAIQGDTRRGIGILANPIYAGRQVWNRSRWVKHPVTNHRVRQERPEAEWVTTDHPELAIVDKATWEAVQRRLKARSRNTGTPGRPPRYLLSGLLRCGECGGPMVSVDRYRYGCARAKDRGTCPGTLRVARDKAEAALLAGVREQLLSETAFRAFQREAAAELKRRAPDGEAAKRRLTEARRERDNIMAAIRAGILTPTTKAELQRAEAAVLDAERAQVQPIRLLPDPRGHWERLLTNMGKSGRARETLRAMIGEAVVKTENGALVAEIAPCQITMVAGEGFGRYLTAPIRIPLTTGRE